MLGTIDGQESMEDNHNWETCYQSDGLFALYFLHFQYEKNINNRKNGDK